MHHTPDTEKDIFIKLLKQNLLPVGQALDLDGQDGEIGVLADDDARNMRNLLIACNVIFCRFAIEERANAEYAYSMSDYFINKTEKLRTGGQFLDLATQMATSYRNLIALSQTPDFGYPIDKCIQYIEQHLYSRLTAGQVARFMKLSPAYLTTLFRQRTGVTLYQFIQQHRLKEAQLMLKSTSQPITAIAAALGYHSLAHFSHAFHQATGISPLDYRRGPTVARSD